MLSPVPCVMVTCGTMEGEKNIITVAWTGTVNTDPPMTYISVRKERYSYHMIKDSGEFGINLVTVDLVRAADWCGVRSGRDFDKFEETGLHAVKAEKIKAPLIEESPLSLECRVREIKELGSHHMFLADIDNVSVSADLIDGTGKLRLDRAGLAAWSHGEYFGLQPHPLGGFGFSVMKKKTKKKRNRKKGRQSR